MPTRIHSLERSYLVNEFMSVDGGYRELNERQAGPDFRRMDCIEAGSYDYE